MTIPSRIYSTKMRLFIRQLTHAKAFLVRVNYRAVGAALFPFDLTTSYRDEKVLPVNILSDIIRCITSIPVNLYRIAAAYKWLGGNKLKIFIVFALLVGLHGMSNSIEANFLKQETTAAATQGKSTSGLDIRCKNLGTSCGRTEF